MRSRYDAESDILYVRFSEVTVVESEEIRPGVVFDYDESGRVVAIEILDASEHLALGADLQRLTAA